MLSPEVWSWLAASLSIVGLWLSGHNPRVGWAYGIAIQTVWVAYGLDTDQTGMLALSVAFVALYSRNLFRWRGTRFVRAAAAREPAGVDRDRPERLAGRAVDDALNPGRHTRCGVDR